MTKVQIQVARSSMPPLEEYVQEIAGIWDNHWLTNFGGLYNELREKLIDHLGVPGISLFTNGHLALQSAIAAFGLSGEVITTPFTFASTTHAIVQNGLKPVFCDIDRDSYCIDANKIEDLISEHTSAIVGVHVYGNLCDVESIERIAQKYGLKVIYDAAHAFCVQKSGVGVGCFGDATIFSFHATKVFHTIEGGAVAYSDRSLDKKLVMLQNFGFGDNGEVQLVGGNAKMSEFQAAMGLCNLRHLEEALNARREVVDRYRDRLANVNGIRILQPQDGVRQNYAYFPVVFANDVILGGRDGVAAALAENGIIARKYFYPLTCDMPCYKNEPRVDLPIAREIASTVLTLPLYEGLTLPEVDSICDVIINYSRQ